MPSKRPLGRRKPTDLKHVEKYPVSALRTLPTTVPVALGINWYTNFDNPKNSKGVSWKPGMTGTFWIGRGSLGTIRGGHCICAKPYGVDDPLTWYSFYNQGNEGACCGFGASRMMSLLNRKRYDAFWLYHEGQKIDEWPGEDYDGTSVRAVCDILRLRGHRVYSSTTPKPESLQEGVSAVRWATTWNEVRHTLGLPDSYDGVPLLNSWGTNYPHIVRMDDDTGARLLEEDPWAEACIVTDR